MISEKLKKQLQEVHAREQDSFHTEEQFIRAVFAGCDTEEKKQKLSGILEKWELTDSDVLLASLDISEGLEPEIEEVS